MKLYIIIFVFFFISIFFPNSYSQNNITNKQQIDSLFILINENTEDTVKINSYYKLAIIYQKENYDTTLIYLSYAENIAKKYIFFSENKKRSFYFKQKYAKIVNATGSIMLQKGDLLNAMNNLQNALRIFEDINDKKNIASVYNSIGIIHEIQENLTLALSYYKKSLHLAKQSCDSIMMCNGYLNIGNIYNIQKKYDDAIEQYNKMMPLAEKIGYQSGILNGLASISGIYLNKNQFDDALKSCTRALDISFKIKSKRDIANCHSIMFKIYSKKGDFQNAVQYFRKCIQVAKEIGSDLIVTESLPEASRLYEQIGIYDTALLFFKRYSLLNDSLLKGKNQRKINEMENNYRLELLKRKNETQQVVVDKQKKFLYIVFSGLVILMFIVIIFFIQKKKMNRAYKDLVMKNIEIVKNQESKPQEAETPQMGPQSDFLDKYASSGLSSELKDELIKKIVYFIEKDKLYMDPDLSITKLSELLNINRTYISQVINEKMNTNFNHFINEYRIKDARKQLLEMKSNNLTIEAIANSVGFNSKSTFHSAFKKFTGVTPSFYIKISKENS